MSMWYFIQGFPKATLLIEKVVDILFIAETKLDSSFRDQLFQVEGYRLEWR